MGVIDRGRTYKAKKGAHLSDRDAERIGRFVEEKGGAGGVSAEEMVRFAKPKRSPIHGDFEWDDTIAGHEFRLTQARRILRSIIVVHKNGSEVETRAFHHVIVERDGESREAYVPAQVVWEQPDLAAQVLEKARRELASWAARYREYKALSAAHGLVEKALELLDLLDEDDEGDEK